MNLCVLCNDPTTNGSGYADFPYCRNCYQTGRAYAHLNQPLLDKVRAAGFPMDVWQTGGGCQNYVIALTEGGWDGPHAYMGFATSTTDWENAELGVQIVAHYNPADKWLEWVGDGIGCACCEPLHLVEEKMNEDIPVMSSADEVADWMISIAKNLAKMVAAHPH